MIGAMRADGIIDREDEVPAHILPDPLRSAAGEAILDAAGWWGRGRPATLAAFAGHVYGRMPAAPHPVVETALHDRDALHGLAERRELLVRLAPTLSPLRVCLWTPRVATRPVPAFVGLNFIGNHAVHPDPGITLPGGWVPEREGTGHGGHVASEVARGALARRWPVEAIVARGYALATAYSGDIAPDDPQAMAGGIHAVHPRQGDDGWGAIGAWAWGLSRALDALTTVPAIDARRVAVIGHSRLGKAALWAAATDQRFALAVSNNSGCGGASLARRRFGETVARITTAFPHWFCPRYAGYAGREDALPVDQHQLLALIAPRPVYIASAEDDLWADPRGEYLACVHADPVHRLLGGSGFAGAADPPALNRSVGGSIGYHVRPGGHDLTPLDWWHVLNFADRWLR